MTVVEILTVAQTAGIRLEARGRTLRVQAPAGALGLIRFRGHFPKGGYDVHDGRQKTETYPTKLY